MHLAPPRAVRRPPPACSLRGLGCAAACALLGLLAAPLPARAGVDVAALWDFSNPALSQQRFHAALATAQGDDALVLLTQIARTHGLQRDLQRARALLQSIQPRLAGARAEVQARHALEWGRIHISALSTQPERTAGNLELARAAYARAMTVARQAGLDGLEIDAMHMMAFVDDAPVDQLRWNQAALDRVLASAQPAGRAWEGSIRHNLGLALHALGRHGESLPQFQRCLELREASGTPRQAYVARWLLARALRLTGRLDEALAHQTWLEGRMQVVGDPDPYVLEELARIHRALGDDDKAASYARRLGLAAPQP